MVVVVAAGIEIASESMVVGVRRGAEGTLRLMRSLVAEEEEQENR